MRAALAGVKDAVAASRKLAHVLPCLPGLAPQDIIISTAPTCPLLIACSRHPGDDVSWVFTKVVLPSLRSSAST